MGRGLNKISFLLSFLYIKTFRQNFFSRCNYLLKLEMLIGRPAGPAALKSGQPLLGWRPNLAFEVIFQVLRFYTIFRPFLSIFGTFNHPSGDSVLCSRICSFFERYSCLLRTVCSKFIWENMIKAHKFFNFGFIKLVFVLC
jgi:hypothetical protein